jgi:tetratricopeptide (TPR) repeat protein
VDEATAKAHYSLAVLLATAGEGQAAIDHFLAAVKYQPSYVEAHVALADALRRNGRAEASLSHYKDALKLNPRMTQARLGYVVALVSLRRYQDARDWLTEATKLFPDQPEFTHALARLLASAPDGRVRDGQRAMTIVQALMKGQKTTALGETMAMALAELGDYQQAAAVQRGVLESARRARLDRALPSMEANLRLYEHHQPCRTPWRDEELVQAPAPPAAGTRD